MAFVLVLAMSASAFAAGAYTVKQIQPKGSAMTVTINRTSDNRNIAIYVADDLNKKYLTSVFLTALSTGKSVDCGFVLSEGKWFFNWVTLYSE